MRKEKIQRVYVTRPIPQIGLNLLIEGGCVVKLRERDEIPSKEELLEGIKGVDALLCLLTEQVDADVIAAGTELKIIANYAVGFDNIDVKAATERGIWVSNTPGVLTETTAEMAWALMFSVARRIVEADRFVRAGKFRGWSATLLLGSDFDAGTLGIIGAGQVGSAVARRAAAFQMQVLYHDLQCNPDLEEEVGAIKVSLNALLEVADFVSVHVPLLPETRHLINAERLGLMKPTAYLINTSRGPVVDEAALVQALLRKEIAGAGLDVYEDEPEVHPGLLGLDNVVLTPHIASASVETRDKMAKMVAKNILVALAGKKPPNAVNQI